MNNLVDLAIVGVLLAISSYFLLKRFIIKLNKPKKTEKHNKCGNCSGGCH